MRLLSLLMVVFWPLVAGAEATGRQIIVSGTGSVAAVPDMATISVGVYREAETAAEATDAMGEALSRVLADIADFGIEARDVQTSSLMLNPVWDQVNARPRQIRGYAASSSLSVRVRDLSGLGDVLDRTIGKGANQFNGLRFQVSDPEPLEQAARANAVERATQKAETLASAAGVALGPVISISETGFDGPAPMMRGAVMEAAAVPIAAGETEVRIAVAIVFAIQD